MLPKSNLLVGLLTVCFVIEYLYVRGLYMSGEIPDKLEFFFDTVLLLGFTAFGFRLFERIFLNRKTTKAQ